MNHGTWERGKTFTYVLTQLALALSLLSLSTQAV